MKLILFHFRNSHNEKEIQGRGVENGIEWEDNGRE